MLPATAKISSTLPSPGSATYTFPLESTATLVGAETAAQRSHTGGGNAAERYLLHLMAAIVGDKDVAVAIHCHSSGYKETGAQSLDAGGGDAADGSLTALWPESAT